MTMPYSPGRALFEGNCEQSRKLRISVTRIENSPDHFFKFGMVFCFNKFT